MNPDAARIAALEASSRIFAGLAANPQAAPDGISDTLIKELAASLEIYLRSGRTQP
jgi:hypothetical protein